MKKLLLFYTLMFFSFYKSQDVIPSNNLPRVEGDTLYTSSGFKIVDGTSIKVGTGSMPDEYKPKTKPLEFVAVNNAISTADELIKLKKLLDDGIITKEEFDAEKTKLLSKK